MGEYRYNLTRDLGGMMGLRDEVLVWVMLNPSTADETADDPTIRRVKSFTAREGYRKLEVVNLFGLRATDPQHLLHSESPEGDWNRKAIHDAMAFAHGVVFAWGASVPIGILGRATASANYAAQQAELSRLTPTCLGKAKHGAPRHPLYVKGDTPLEIY